jgi:hypothetical protein
MNRNEDLSIAGGWLGTYYYRGSQAWQEPTRFEASFVQKADGGQFSGTILDDGPLGEANVSGTQTGRVVEFTKVYNLQHPFYETAPIVYEGTMAEDGLTITGVWAIRSRSSMLRRSRVHGVWEAHRLWSAEEEAQSPEIEENLSLARPLVHR